jgi:predicted transposase/invertase (TIGR01784 family)
METNYQNWDGQRILDIRYDPVLKAVFTRDTAKSRGALSDLISAFIGRTVAVDVITANEPPVEDTRQRYLRFDVNCKTDKGEPINVEMSFNPKPDEPVSLEYHAARLYTGQDIHGKDKTYRNLKETYQIAILAKKTFFRDDNFVHTFLYYDPETRVSLGGRTRIITVELEKTEPIADKPVEAMTNAELWAVFFQYLTDSEKRGKIQQIINREEGIAMALDTLGTITQDEIDYAYESSLIKGELDWRSDMEYAKLSGLEEGMAEGLSRGRAEGIAANSLEIARKLKGLGLTVSQIAESTGLPPETIAKL